MKRIVWLNRSNGQLCVTVPKDSGIKDGDIVSIEKEKIRSIAYTTVTGDLFHYGHLRLLQNANNLADFHICGVLTDEAIREYKEGPVAGLKERKSIFSEMRCVDMVMVQNSLDPTENLKQIHEQFPKAKITLVFGSNWKDVPGAGYIKKIGGEIFQPPYYEKLSASNVMKAISKNYMARSR